MGCFNRTGFISHLPISYQDEIVVFLLADTSRIDYINSIPCYPNSSGYTPLSIPFFGTYDDYGSIEGVRDNFNSRYFQKKVGISVEDACEALISNKSSGMTFRKIINDIERLKDSSCTEPYKKEDIKKLETLKTIYKGILNITEEDEQKVLNNVEGDWWSRELVETTIIFTMEHKFIYDKMSEIDIQKFPGDEDYSFLHDSKRNQYTIEEKFDNTNKCIQLFANRKKKVNPLTFNIDNLYDLMDIDELQELIDNNQSEKIKELIDEQNKLRKYSHYDFISIHARLSGGLATPLEYHLYTGCCEDISEMKEDVIKYVQFLDMMRTICVVFTLSPYHNQTIDYDRMVAFCDANLSLMKAKKAEYELKISELENDKE